jgi:hypothetical protein
MSPDCHLMAFQCSSAATSWCEASLMLSCDRPPFRHRGTAGAEGSTMRGPSPCEMKANPIETKANANSISTETLRH